jgi:signal transduction histidine kinase
MPFAYLFHVVLACIFFSRRESFVVVVVAAALYAGCLLLERACLVAPGGIYAATGQLGHGGRLSAEVFYLNAASCTAIWFVVWYLASKLSDAVRARDVKLAEVNRELVEAQAERARHMLRTTHELKAPFAAIHANAHLLLGGYCGPMSEESREVLLRIAARCRRLARQIQEMLQLANLRSVLTNAPSIPLDLAEELDWCIAQVTPMADERRVRIVVTSSRAPATAAQDHVRMLISNLLTNAVTYSRDGGLVRVACGVGPLGAPELVVEDQGIGISEAKLPKIFDDFYRTEEAVKHNKESTGLGLAIVKHVAQTYGIRVRVESAPDVGTRFTLKFPHGERPA